MAERAREQVTCFRKCLNNNKHFSRTGTDKLPFPCGRTAVETSLLANLPPFKTQMAPAEPAARTSDAAEKCDFVENNTFNFGFPGGNYLRQQPERTDL